MEHLRLGKSCGSRTCPVKADGQGTAGCRKTLSSFRMELSADPSREGKGKGSWQVCVCLCVGLFLGSVFVIKSLTTTHTLFSLAVYGVCA